MEYSIPRLGKRADAVLLIDGIIFILEYKVGEKGFNRADSPRAATRVAAQAVTKTLNRDSASKIPRQ